MINQRWEKNVCLRILKEDSDVFVSLEILSVMKESNICPQYETIAAVKYTEMLVTRLNFI